MNTENFNLLIEDKYFNNLINKEFEKSDFNFTQPLPKAFESNKIRLLNGFNLPKCKYYLDTIINYTKNEISSKFIKNEGELRKQINDKKIEDNCNKYYEELNKLENNIQNEIKKEEYLRKIFNSKNNEIAKLL